MEDKVDCVTIWVLEPAIYQSYDDPGGQCFGIG